jgi:hypothetical protein
MKFFYLILSVFIFTGFILADDGKEFPKEFEHGNDGYMKKSFTKGSGSPKIMLETASGKVELKK